MSPDVICQQIKIKLRSFKSSEHINEKRDGSYRGFGYLRFLITIIIVFSAHKYFIDFFKKMWHVTYQNNP